MYLTNKYKLPVEEETDLIPSKYLKSPQLDQPKKEEEKEEKPLEEKQQPQKQEQQLSNVSLLETPDSVTSESFSTTPLPLKTPLHSIDSNTTIALLDSARAINHNNNSEENTFISPTNKEKSVVVLESEYSTPDQKIFNPIECNSNDNSFSIPNANTDNTLNKLSSTSSPIKAKLKPIHNKNIPAYLNTGVVVEPQDISIYVADDDDEESEPVHFNTMPIKLPKDLIAKARTMREAATKDEEDKEKENIDESNIEEDIIPATSPIIHHKKNNSLDDNILLHNNDKDNNKRKGKTIILPPPLDLKSKNSELSPKEEQTEEKSNNDNIKLQNPIINVLKTRNKIPSDELYMSLKQYVSELVYIKDFFEMEKDLPKWKKFSSTLKQSTLLENRKNSFDFLLLQPNDGLFWVSDIRWLHCSQMIHMTMLITPDTPFGTCSIAINRYNETISSLIKRNFLDKNKISTIFASKSFKDEIVLIGTVPYVLPPVTHPNVKPIPDWNKKLPFNTNKSAYQFIETLWKSFNAYRCPIVNGYTFYEDINHLSHLLGSIILTEKDGMIMMELVGLSLSNPVTLSLPNVDINNLRELIENRFPLQEKSKP